MMTVPRSLIEEHFGTKETETYDCLSREGRMDLWKFCFLYTHGGVYIREDLNLLDALDNLIDNTPETLFYDSNFNVSDGIIAVQNIIL